MTENEFSTEYMVKANIGLVHACVKKFVNSDMEYEDIFQAGCVGLIKAVNRFDSSRGFKFSTYAVPLIIGEIKGLFRYGAGIKMPRELKKFSGTVYKEIECFENMYARAPTVCELSEKMNVSKEKICEALAAKNPIVYTENESFTELLSVDDSYESALTDKLTLREAYKNLSDDDKELLHLRFALNRTQSEAAKIFGVSQMQISRREKRILLYLKGVFSE